MKLEKRLDNIQILLDTYILPMLEHLQKNAERTEVNKEDIKQLYDSLNDLYDYLGLESRKFYKYKGRMINA